MRNKVLMKDFGRGLSHGFAKTEANANPFNSTVHCSMGLHPLVTI